MGFPRFGMGSVGSASAGVAQNNTAIVNTGASQAVPLSPVVLYTVTEATTLTLPASAGVATGTVAYIEVWLFQNGTGGYAVTWAGNGGDTITWDSSASAPSLNTTANKLTRVLFSLRGGTTIWRGQLAWKEN